MIVGKTSATGSAKGLLSCSMSLASTTVSATVLCALFSEEELSQLWNRVQRQCSLESLSDLERLVSYGFSRENVVKRS